MRVISPITDLRKKTPTPLSIDYLDAEGPLLHEPKVIVFLNQQILFLSHSIFGAGSVLSLALGEIDSVVRID